MARSYHEIYIHCIWSTKNREPIITKEIEPLIYDLIKNKCKKFEYMLIAIGNTEDHIHIFLEINLNHMVKNFIAEIKGITSYLSKKEKKINLYWQNGYGVISISKPSVEKVKEYVENQKEHHRIKNKIVEIFEKSNI